MLYAYYKSGNDDLRLAESELQHSINKGYDLYYTLLLLVTEVTRYAELRQDAATHRKQRNVSNLVQHNRFIGNRFAQQLSENEQFQEYLSENKLSWTDFQNVVKNLFERIEESSYYEAYIEEEESYQHDKDLWIKVFKKEILGNELLEEALEELSIYWLDDLEIVLSFVVKTIRSFDESKGSMQNLLPKYKDDSDYSFVIRLFQNAILNSEEYRTLISRSEERRVGKEC